MSYETQMELLRVSKKALVLLSINSKDRDFVFEIRDVIRKAEREINERIKQK